MALHTNSVVTCSGVLLFIFNNLLLIVSRPQHRPTYHNYMCYYHGNNVLLPWKQCVYYCETHTLHVRHVQCYCMIY